MREQHNKLERTGQTAPALKMIMDASPVGIVLFNSDAKVIYINILAAQIFGKPASAADILKCKDFIESPKRHTHLHGCGHTKTCPDCPISLAICNPQSDDPIPQILEGRFLMEHNSGINPVWIKYRISTIMMEGAKFVIMAVEDITACKHKEENLHNALAELSVFHNHVSIAMILLGKNQQICKANDFAAKFADRPVNEMIGLQSGEALRCLHNQDDPRGCGFGKACTGCPVHRVIAVAFETGTNQPDTEVWLHLDRDGSSVKRCLQVSTAYLKVNGDEKVLVSFQDVTDRKLAEIATRESHQRLLRVLDSINAIVYVIDMDSYDILFANEYIRNKFGAVEGKKCWNAIHSDQNGPCPFCNNEKLVDPEGHPTGIYRWEFQNKKTGKWYDCHDSAIKWVDGRIVKLEFAIDITDRKLAEEAFQNNYALLRIAGKTAKLGGWSVDIFTNRVKWSDEVAAIHEMPAGYSPTVDDGIRFYAPDWRDKISKVFKDCVTKGIAYDEEMEIITATGKRVWVRTNAEAIRDESGKIIKVHGSFQDISDRKQVEEELKNRGSLLNKIFDLLPIGLWFADKNGKILRGNPAGIKIWGSQPLVSMEQYGVFKARRLPSGQNIAPDDWALVHTIKRGVTVKDELLEIDAFDGRKKTILNYTAPVLDNNGNIVGAIVMNNDITEQKQAEEALRASEEKYRRITENISDVVWVTDLNLKKIYMSPSVERLLGEPFEVVMNKSMEELFPPHSLNKIFSTLEEELEKEKDPKSDKSRSRMIELEQYRTGQTRFWVSVNATFIRDANGKPIAIQGVTRDITERKRVEDHLRRSEEYNRSIIEVIPDIIMRISSKGEYLDIITSSEDKLFRPKESLLGKKISDFFPKPTAETIMKAIHRALETKSLQIVEYELEVMAGKFLFEGRVVPLGQKETIVLIRDMTEQKRAVEEQARLHAQLTQAQKMESVGRLAGGVAHDYNNMLVVIMGYAELAMEKLTPDDPFYSYFEEILVSARRSSDITRQLLAFARKQTIDPKVLDLNETVESMLKMLRRLIGEDIDLVWFPDSHLWPVKIDPAQIDQILANLCVNARDAISGVGKITIKTLKVSLNQTGGTDNTEFYKGDYAQLTISDTGCGMDKETLDKIFEPFFTTKDFGKGTGLGLATVYGIVKQNNGFVNVCSEPGKGATFEIYFPRYTGECLELKDKKNDNIPTSRGETLLLVEDEPAIMKMSRMMLENLGYPVLAANSPGEAIALAETHCGKIDLLITDVIMPEMNGRDLAKKLHQLYPDIKTLFMSGYTSDVIAHHGVLDKGVYFIQKPFSKKEIAVKIRTVIEKASS